MLPTGTVTFLFTDIEGSTPLWEKMPAEMQAAVAQHHALLRQAIENNGGHVFQILGDAFQAAFRLASQALCAALEAQRALQSVEWGDTGPIRVRMGLHTGPAELDPLPGPSGKPEYQVCHTLNRAARVMSAGFGGQILISRECANLVERELPAGVSLRDLGEHRLKGMQRLEHLYQVLAADLQQDFPPMATGLAHPHNLPLQLTSFIGREKEIAQLQKLFKETNTRLVTITGTGGMGKTRLALQLAEELLDAFPDGIWLVELAALVDPDDVPLSVATALRIRETPGQSVTAVLREYLALKHMLVILDNCEHVVGVAADLVNTLLLACPYLHVLATSQEILGLDGETLFRCPPLLFFNPDQPHPASEGKKFEQASASESVRLFIERAAAALPGFTLNIKNATTVIDICRRLEGIPLAIELAAARVRLLSVEQIASRLEDVFDLLTAGGRARLPRHQTLKALIDWSYNLLTANEQTVLMRLSVFSGGWDLAAAEAVASDGGIKSSQVLGLMGQLVDKSLILVESSDSSENRFQMLETIRQYACERLNEAGEINAVRDQHLEYYFRMAEQAKQHMWDEQQGDWFRRLSLEVDNLRNALRWALVEGPRVEENNDMAGRMASSLWYFWYLFGSLKEGRSWISAALDRNPQWNQTRASLLQADGTLAWQEGKLPLAISRLRESMDLFTLLEDQTGLAEATHMYGHAVFDQQNYTEAGNIFQRCLSLYEELGDRSIRIALISDLGLVACHKGDLPLARKYYEEGLALFVQNGFRDGEAQSYVRLGDIARLEGDYGRAEELYEKSLLINRELKISLEIACSLHKLGFIALHQGEMSHAQALFCESLALQRESGNQQGLAECLAGLASQRVCSGDFEGAAKYFGAANQILTRTGLPLGPADLAEWRRDEELARSRCDSISFERAWLKGMNEPVDDMVVSLLAAPPSL
ncbi:MAG: tetratricopeptide repeat protein [Chloroflexi bacterium]|nr:tetratricopeptide repeat protein [Chloroflexota bacterium]